MTVIQFTPKAENSPPEPQPPSHEPLLRLPPHTTALIIILVVIHAVLSLGDMAFNGLMLAAYTQGGFIPASLTDTLTGALAFQPMAVLSILTAGFLHGSWMHLGVNCAMLLACGSGVERAMGAKWLWVLLIGGILAGNLTYFAFDPDGIYPLVGASGGISALFGAAMLALGGADKRQIAVWLALFIGLSMLQAYMGGPNGEKIAGAAHIGGFVYGLGVALSLREKRGKLRGEIGESE
jgi:membrane associated rhomboid family serine protease